MIAVDTNVLVRALVDDPGAPRQTAVARARLKQAQEVYVPQIVQVEMVWVLDAAHKLRRSEILAVLTHLGENTAFHLQNRAQFEMALTEYGAGNADFADYLILAESRAKNMKLLTFDKRLQKSTGVEAP